MFDSLDPPADLGTARARLQAAAERLAGSGSVFHLDPVDRVGAGQSWPGIGDDATVVVADSVLWRTGPKDLLALASALGQERSLLFLEPTADVGWRGLMQRLGPSWWRRAVGHHFVVDVPVVLRAAGLEVVDLNRFGVGSAEVRSYALGRSINPG